MRTLLRWIFRVIEWIAIFYGACLVIYLPWAWWEFRQMNSLCSEIKPGMAMTALPSLLEKYGFDQRWLEKKGYPRRDGNWIMYIPTTTSFGDYGCHITHDNVKVVSAEAPQ
jgi:hypothetical protein